MSFADGDFARIELWLSVCTRNRRSAFCEELSSICSTSCALLKHGRNDVQSSFKTLGPRFSLVNDFFEDRCCNASIYINSGKLGDSSSNINAPDTEQPVLVASTVEVIEFLERYFATGKGDGYRLAVQDYETTLERDTKYQ